MQNVDNSRIGIDKSYNRNEQIKPFTSNKPISGLAISCDIVLNSDSGLVRIILVDENYKEYFVCEVYPLLIDSKIISLKEYAEETASLNKIIGGKNLKTTKFNDGTPIPLVPVEGESPGYYNYNYSFLHLDAYKLLNNWYTVNTGKLCPTDWHVPNDAEWLTLVTFLGGYEVAGGKLKEAGSAHWEYGNKATNESGFTALPGQSLGYIDDHDRGYWWSSSDGGEWMMHGGYYSGIYSSSSTKSFCLSIRCLRD